MEIATLLVFPFLTSAMATYFLPGVVKKLAEAVAGTEPSVSLKELVPLVLLAVSVAIVVLEDHNPTLSQFPIRPSKFTSIRPVTPSKENKADLMAVMICTPAFSVTSCRDVVSKRPLTPSITPAKPSIFSQLSFIIVSMSKKSFPSVTGSFIYKFKLGVLLANRYTSCKFV
ncbi:hypothetical protein D3C74_287080 [compost metagenome]